MILRVIASLIFVLALAIVLLKFGLPIFVRARSRSKSRVKVIEIVSLDRQHRLAIIQVEEQSMLIGYGGGAFTRLAQWSGPDSKPGNEFEAQTNGILPESP